MKSFQCAIQVAVTMLVAGTTFAHEVTFSSDIAKIVFDNCSACHRPSQSGPFSLLTYEDVTKHSSTIQAVIDSGYMPPWKPINTGIAFANNRQLDSTEKTKLKTWIAADCPLGDRSQIPTTPAYVEGWSLGTPDLIVKMDQPFPIPATGPDLYRSFVLPIGLPTDKWVKAMELRPTARNAVHHALFFIDVTGNAKNQRERDGKPGSRGMNFLRSAGSDFLTRGPDQLIRGLGSYVPGAVPNRLPGDLARLLPKGSDIVMQTHFHPSGKPEVEQAELGLYFADQPPSKTIFPIQLPPLFGIGAGIDIPAGEANYIVTDRYVLPIDVQGIEIGGHAHYICRELSMIAKLPDGTQRELLKIDDWDLDWQDQYQFASPVDLPKGTELSVKLVYDNSASNPENPFTPPQRIEWGRESTDEMGAVTLHVVPAREDELPILENDIRRSTRESLKARIQSQTRGFQLLSGGQLGNGGLAKLLDRNGDGKIQEQEIPERIRSRLLDLLDRNGDYELGTDELEAGRKSIEKLMQAGNR